jgi:parallel beta-helix repeat protein
MKHLIFILLFCFFFIESAEAATYYVKASCTNNITTYNPTADTCTGGSDRVYSHPQNAIDGGLLAAGDIIDIRAGTYGLVSVCGNTGLGLCIHGVGGTASNRITLRGHAGETVVIGGLGFLWEDPAIANYWDITNLTIDGMLPGANLSYNAFYLAKQSNVRVTNSTIRNGPLHCIQSHGNFFEIRNSKIHDCGVGGGVPGIHPHGDYGIYHSASDGLFEYNEWYRITGYAIHNLGVTVGPNDRNVYRYNVIHDSGGTEGDQGIVLSTGDNHQFYGNIVYHNSMGVQVAESCTNCKVYNNTIFENGGPWAWGVGGDTYPVQGVRFGNSSAIIKNNIIYGHGINGILDTFGVGFPATISNNHCDSADTGCSTTGNPRFADSANRDFRLCSAAGVPHSSCVGVSVAIDAGVALGAPYDKDYSGTSRPQGAGWDIGAYESGIAPPAPFCPKTPAQVVKLGMDEGAGLPQDISGANNHITALGSGNSWQPSGKYGKAVTFGGSAAATITHSNSLWLCTGYTLMAWVKPSNTPTDFVSLVSNAIGSSSQTYYVYTSSTGFCGAGKPIAGYQQGGQEATACYGTGFTQGVWTHYAATWNGATIRIYINGSEVTTGPGTATLDQPTGPFYLGGSVFGEYFIGDIDEIKGWNYALSGAQIITEMNTPITPIAPPTETVTIKLGAVTKKVGGITEKVGLAP